MQLAVKIKDALKRAIQNLSGEVPEGERIHPEFKYHNHDHGFHYNASLIGYVNDTHRLQVFLNKDELSKLNLSPYMGKIAPNENASLSYDFCAFFYVNSDQRFSDLENWSKEQGFQKVVTFHTPPTDYISPKPL